MRVLVIEDDEDFRNLVLRWFRNCGIDATGAYVMKFYADTAPPTDTADPSGTTPLPATGAAPVAGGAYSNFSTATSAAPG